MTAINKMLCLLAGLGIMLSGCGDSKAVSALGVTPEAAPLTPAPTSTSLFDAPASQPGNSGLGTAPSMISQPDTDSQFRPMFGQPESSGTAELSPMTASPATPIVVPTAASVVANEYLEVVIFGDKVDANWSLEQSNNVAYDPFDTAHWFRQLDDQHDSGAVSLAVTPLADFGKLFFTVIPGTNVTYERSQVLGISLWLNSGGDILDTDDLVITVVGSDELPYWAADDHSVFADSGNTFSETRLYHLGMNRAIPPDTWVQVVLWLDDLQFDPIYENIVGFYIKNDAGFEHTYYIDNVSLLVSP